MTAAATKEDQYWHLHRSDFRNTLTYAHTNLRALSICDVSLGLQKVNMCLKLETLQN